MNDESKPYSTQVGDAEIKSAAPVTVKRELDGGKGDSPRANSLSADRRYASGYDRMSCPEGGWHDIDEDGICTKCLDGSEP